MTDSVPRLFGRRKPEVPKQRATEFRGWRELRPLDQDTMTSGALLAFGALFLFFCDWLLRLTAEPILIDGPPTRAIGLWGFGIACLVVLVVRSSGRQFTQLLRRTLVICGALVASAGISHLLMGTVSFASSVAGPEKRLQLAYGRSSRTLIFTDQSGLEMSSSSLRRRGLAYGRSGRCFLARRIDGPFGYSWLELLDASPLPGRGHLAWPIAADDCFSDKPLSTLGR